MIKNKTRRQQRMRGLAMRRHRKVLVFNNFRCRKRAWKAADVLFRTAGINRKNSAHTLREGFLSIVSGTVLILLSFRRSSSSSGCARRSGIVLIWQ
jgi:hypothetical protein